ncbi:MAG: amidohydrolase [Fibrobacter sp.]|jgi:5-methylthioadenosine/S-adenosylhomocysteine deaminase|nr:amidohydrolase [Fibrobacter sp.]
MSFVLLKSVLHRREVSDILIRGNRFEKIAPHIEAPAGTRVSDCSGKAIVPPFYNGHTHAAMTLLRGYADDLPLFDWLSRWIWPMETHLTPEDIYFGSRLAILEMIKSGTVFFADMYWHREETIRAAEEMGVRANIGVTFADSLMSPEAFEKNIRYLRQAKMNTERIRLSVTPHAIYTVGAENFKRLFTLAEELDLVFHTHLSETEKEAADCKQKYGQTPVGFLDSLGVLSPRTVLAHGVHLTAEDIEILRERGVTVVHNPASNMKLSSGVLNLPELIQSGVNLALGTDGASSSNNLDMREAMKLAALLTKLHYGSDRISSETVFEMATRGGARAYGIDAGLIEEGKLADALLLNLSNERLVPTHNLIPNWVYAAGSEAIDSVICDGKFLMENRIVPGEAEIIASAEAAAEGLWKKFRNP